MSGLKLTDEKLAETILKLVRDLPHSTTLKLTIRHDGEHKSVRWWHTPIDKQRVSRDD